MMAKTGKNNLSRERQRYVLCYHFHLSSFQMDFFLLKTFDNFKRIEKNIKRRVWEVCYIPYLLGFTFSRLVVPTKLATFHFI